MDDTFVAGCAKDRTYSDVAPTRDGRLGEAADITAGEHASHRSSCRSSGYGPRAWEITRILDAEARKAHAVEASWDEVDKAS